MRNVKVELFLSYPIVSDYAGALNVDPERLKFVYEMDLAVSTDASEDGVLERVFHTFNVNHPSDYRHRSFSVGDVVTLDSKCSYICAPIGWQPVNVMLRSKQRAECSANHRWRLPRQSRLRRMGLYLADWKCST